VADFSEEDSTQIRCSPVLSQDPQLGFSGSRELGMQTSGKGPGLTLRASNGSGTVHVQLDPEDGRGVLHLLDSYGGLSQLRLSPDEMRAVAQALLRVAAASLAWGEATEISRNR
jgi:hypothetical protein